MRKLKSSETSILDHFSIGSKGNFNTILHKAKFRFGHISLNLSPQELASKLDGVVFDSLSFKKKKQYENQKNEVFRNIDFGSFFDWLQRNFPYNCSQGEISIWSYLA